MTIDKGDGSPLKIMGTHSAVMGSSDDGDDGYHVVACDGTRTCQFVGECAWGCCSTYHCPVCGQDFTVEWPD